MDVFNLVAKLILDDSQYQQKLKEAPNDVAQSAEKTKKGMLTLTAAGAAAVGAFATAAVKTGAEFDTSMSQVAATMGKTVDELSEEVGTAETSFGSFEGNLREFAQFMGANTAFSATQAADALNYMALAGYDAQKSMDMLPTVLDLAAAGNMDLARASDMVTDAQSALGLDMKQTAEMVDKMAMASSKSNTSVEQLGDAFLTIGATARSVKGGTTELATILGVLADNGIKGSEGGTHLRNMILSLQSPTDEAADLLKTMGISLYDNEGNMRSLIDVIGDLQRNLGGLDQASKDAIIGGIFNKTDLAAVNALIGTSAERFNELTGYIDGAAGAATRMASTQLDNLEGDITLLKSAFEGLQIQIADKLMPTIRKGVKFLTNLIEDFDEIAPKIAGAAAAFGTFAVAINIGSIVKKVTTAVKGLFLVLSANPIAIVIAAIAGLVTWFVTAYKTNEEFREKVDETWQAITTFITTAWETIKEVLETAKEELIADWENFKIAIETVKEWLIELWNTFWEWITTTIQTLIEFFVATWETIKTGVEETWTAITEFLTETWENIKEKASETWDNMKATIVQIWTAIKEWFITTWDNIKAKAEETWNNIKNTANTIWNAIKALLSALWESIKNKASETWDNMKSTAIAKWNSLKTNVQQIVSNLKYNLEQAWENIKNTVADKVQQTKQKVVDKFNEIKDEIKRVIDRIKEILKFDFQFPHIKTPHFNVSSWDTGWGFTLPSVSVDWYRKAYNNPYLFTKPTVAGFGDGNGGEMVYGHASLMKDIRDAVGGIQAPVINIYPQKGQSEEEIARSVEKVLLRFERQRKAASFA